MGGLFRGPHIDKTVTFDMRDAAKCRNVLETLKYLYEHGSAALSYMQADAATARPAGYTDTARLFEKDIYVRSMAPMLGKLLDLPLVWNQY